MWFSVLLYFHIKNIFIPFELVQIIQSSRTYLKLWRYTVLNHIHVRYMSRMTLQFTKYLPDILNKLKVEYVTCMTGTHTHACRVASCG